MAMKPDDGWVDESKKVPMPGPMPPTPDPWVHRSEGMRCRTCMFFVPKARTRSVAPGEPVLGRCRRHAPTMHGFPAVFETDWCGDHKLDENK